MIKNLFTVALRTFLRQKFYSFINVFGLSAGLTCTLFIYLWINDELSKDNFHNDSDRIFRAVSNFTLNDGEVMTWTDTPGPLAEDIKENIAEVETVVRTMGTGSLLFQHENKNFMERGYYADPDFFNMFNFKIIKGKPANDSTDISIISISEKLSRKLFNEQDPIGKTLKVNEKDVYTVGAVFEDVTTKSSMQFDYILPYEVYKKARGGGFDWGNFDHPTYIKLHEASALTEATNKINDRVAKIAASLKSEDHIDFYFQPFKDSYLYSHFENGKPVGGRIKYVKIFSLVAVFILVIACINFMNMATAKAAGRAKEVGVRKVIGAQRKSLILQFIAESVFISAIAMVVALSVVYLLLPLFNTVVEKAIEINFDANFMLAVVFIVLLTGLLAGSYPAFFISSYEPAQVLKGSMAKSFAGAGLRKVLVVFQFSLTVILIASSLVVYQQIEYIRNKNLGYDRESILTLGIRGNLRSQFESFKNELLQSSGITHVSKANESLVQVNNQNGSVEWPGKTDKSQQFFRTVVVDYDYLETMGLKLQQGRLFAKAFNDTSNFVITQRAAEVMGMQDPIGQQISQWGIRGKIVGVVDDFHSRSLHESIDPVIFMCNPNWASVAVVRFNGSEAQQTIKHVEKVYNKYNPEYPFNYSFVDEDFEKLYNNEKVTGTLALTFTIMVIIISGLGLLGLAAYTAEKRKKEISIRKTLGANVTGIVSMMSTDFIKLSTVAVIIGCPVAYFLMQQFLEGYAYHQELGWEVFIITGCAVTILVIATVIFQVTKAALANPVDALRNE
jgi:predicted permease